MKRYFCCLAALAVLALPDWASACWPLWGHPVYPTPLYVPPPVYTVPVYPPAYIYPPVFYPAPTIPPAKVETAPRSANPVVAPSTTVSPGKTSSINTPSQPSTPNQKTGDAAASTKIAPPKVEVETIRPSGLKETVATPIAPQKKPDAPQAAPLTVPALNSSTGLPKLELPKEMENRSTSKEKEGDQAKKAVPIAIPVPAPGDPLRELPSQAPKNSGPTLTLPGSMAPATPSAAPAFTDLIPQSSLPLGPGTTKPDSLPSLTLPPDVPVVPAAKTDSKSHSSPLTGMGAAGLTVDIFPVAPTEKKIEGYRAVTFFNHTNHEVNLSIEGRTVKLPAKCYVETKLTQTFQWAYGDRQPGSERIPADAAGLDIVFRE